VTPLSTISGSALTREAITGRLAAIASSATKPKPSHRDGMSNTSNAPISDPALSRHPRK
jgi:hypothetical protein